MDIDKAFSVNNGILVDEDSGGPFYTGGTAPPMGLDLPESTFYLQTGASGVLVWRKFGSGLNDWRRLSAQDVPFSAYGSSIRADNVDAVLREFRHSIVYDPRFTASSLNGFYQITETDNTLQIITGTALGFSVNLPDAATQFKGAKFEVVNKSSQSIVIRDYSNFVLATLNPGDAITATLQDNETSAGEWILLVVSSIASGVQAFNVTSDALFSTSSALDVLLTDMNITPNSGTYAVWFSSDLVISQNNRIAQCVVYKNNLVLENTRRAVQGVGSNYSGNFQTLGIVSVNGAEVLDVRVNISTGSISISGRSFLLIRLGPEL